MKGCLQPLLFLSLGLNQRELRARSGRNQMNIIYCPCYVDPPFCIYFIHKLLRAAAICRSRLASNHPLRRLRLFNRPEA